MELQTRILETQSMYEIIIFAFGLLLSIPTIGNQNETKLIWPCIKLQT
jgi:hypothetical protein